MAHPIGPPKAHGIKVRELTNDEREAVVMSLLERSRDGVLRLGAITEVGENFHVRCQAISKIWKPTVNVH